MIGDVIEVTKLLTNVMKEQNTCSVIKEQKKIEKKLNQYHIDNVLMQILDNVIQSLIESNEEYQHRNDKESMNRTKEDTKSTSECMIEMEKVISQNHRN